MHFLFIAFFGVCVWAGWGEGGGETPISFPLHDLAANQDSLRKLWLSFSCILVDGDVVNAQTW